MHISLHINETDTVTLSVKPFATLPALTVNVYLHKKGYDEDSVPLPQSVLQRVEQGAVPVNQMELNTDSNRIQPVTERPLL